jgi:flagellar biosynthesis protein
MSDEPHPREAAALSYEAGQNAPRVVATGRGQIAERIIAAAREAGVPVRSDPALARALAALDLGEEVPEAMYRAVAETLAWAYKLDAQASGRAPGPKPGVGGQRAGNPHET